MAKSENKYRIFLSAAEPSGDKHCAELMKTLKSKTGDIEFVGVGGELMKQQGCELLEETASKAAMGYNVLGQLGRFIKLISKIRKYLKNNKTDLVVVCDSPAFNFHIAKAAKDRNIKTCFYVAPQLWAWGSWRVGKLRRLCDKLLCILPFEQEWFSKKGINAEFVGNPMLEGFGGKIEKNAKDYKNYQPRNAKIALLPGSRAAEIENLWEPIQRVAVKLRKRFPKADFTTLAADEPTKEVLRSLPVLGFRSKYVVGSVEQTVSEADLAIVASGSVTLQLAGAGCPIVVVYESNKFLWRLLGKWIIRTKYLSLVNILAGKELVPEFMPYIKSEQKLLEKCTKILQDREYLAATSKKLTELVSPLAKTKASHRTAEIIMQMLDSKADS